LNPHGGTLAGIDPARLWLGDWWKDEDLPVDWDRFWPGGGLSVEVGFGGGEFLLTSARLSPGKRFVGIEHYAEGFRKCLKQALSEGLGNLLLMQGDAYVILNVAFGDSTLESVTVNFPDPWPKARHARRRLFTEEFFKIAARKLAPGGALLLATDDRPYAEQAVRELAGVTELASRHPAVPWQTESPRPVRTRYEKKWIAEGRPLHHFVYEKKGFTTEGTQGSEEPSKNEHEE
jgi:tRNA (guanine-N7-)-methyltransferase